MRKQSYWKRTAAVVMVASMAAGLAGCGKKQDAETSVAASTEAKAEGESAAAPADFSYPMAKGEPLQYWLPPTTTVTANFANLGDTPFAKGLMENTGIDIEFLQPPQG